MSKPQFAILRFAKYKGPEISNIEAHNERTKDEYASNPDIDKSRSCLNFHLLEPEHKYRAEAERQIKDAGKIAIVHADLISGLAAKEISVDFLHSTTLSDGIISTRTNMIQRAKELQMIAILRVFLIDSMAFDAALGARNLKPDAIDILPGLMPSMIRKVRQMTGIPVLTGGLITEKREVMQALEAGALAISSTAPDVWKM